MSLRVKLLLVSLMTLILPWAGWQYAQRMETTLRHGQEESLITTADVLSRVVASQPELLYRFPDELSDDFDPARGDLFAPLLSTTPLLDGFADEWPIPSRPVAGFDDGSGLRLGLFGRYLYAYFDVRDANVAYEDPSSESRGESATSRVIFLTRDEFDRERAWSVSAIAPGPIIARPSDVGAPWRSSPDQIQHVTGVWRATARGYAIELRVPVSMFGKQLTVFALDRQGRTGATPTLGRLHIASDALRERLEQYTPRGLRVSVVDRRGWLLARAGSVEISSASYARQDEDGFARSIYRQLFGGRDAIAVSYGLPYGMWGAPVDAARDGKNEAIWFEPAGGEPSLVRAAVPVHAGDQTLAALVVEQPAEQLAVVREDALTRLLNLTLLATLFSVVITLAFAARLSQRIRRLSRAVASAMTPEGRLEQHEQREDLEPPREHAQREHELHRARHVPEVVEGAHGAEAGTHVAERRQGGRHRGQHVVAGARDDRRAQRGDREVGGEEGPHARQHVVGDRAPAVLHRPHRARVRSGSPRPRSARARRR